MTEQTDKLRPCPFCGRAPLKEWAGNGKRTHKCSNSGCTIWKNTEAWNHRPLETELLKALEDIKWKSADKDNMEFSALITTWQRTAIVEAIAKMRGQDNDGATD